MLGIVVGAIGIVPNPVSHSGEDQPRLLRRVTNVTDRVLGEALYIVVLPIEEPSRLQETRFV